MEYREWDQLLKRIIGQIGYERWREFRRFAEVHGFEDVVDKLRSMGVEVSGRDLDLLSRWWASINLFWMGDNQFYTQLLARGKLEERPSDLHPLEEVSELPFLNDNQKAAIRAYYEYLIESNKRKGIIEFMESFERMIIGIRIAIMFLLDTIIVVPARYSIEPWRELFITLGVKKEKISTRLTGGKTGLLITTYTDVYRHPDKVGDYGFIIFDECSLLASPKYIEIVKKLLPEQFALGLTSCLRPSVFAPQKKKWIRELIRFMPIVYGPYYPRRITGDTQKKLSDYIP